MESTDLKEKLKKTIQLTKIEEAFATMQKKVNEYVLLFTILVSLCTAWTTHAHIDTSIDKQICCVLSKQNVAFALSCLISLFFLLFLPLFFFVCLLAYE